VTLGAFSQKAANAYAKAWAQTLGQAVSELLLRGCAEKLPIKQENGVWVFDLPPAAPSVTFQQLQKLFDQSV
jgi:hypothetical protein